VFQLIFEPRRDKVRVPDDHEEGKGRKRCRAGAKGRKGEAPKANARTAQRHCSEGSEGSMGKGKKAKAKLITIISIRHPPARNLANEMRAP
jgi:hypothetical protein